MTPLISVIMPVRNAAGTVGAAIESITNQTFKRFELIIVNDGSTDETSQILNSHNDPRLMVIHQNHRGIAKSLNRAIGLARSPLIARMDADDVSSPERLKAQYLYLQKHPDTGVVGSLVTFKGDCDKRKGYFLYCQWVNTLVSSHDIYINRFVDSPLAHPTVLFRKEMIDNYGGYDESELPEDYELWLRWMEKGVRFAKVDKELLIWSDLPCRLSRTHSNYSREAFYKIKTRYLANWIYRKYQSKLPDIWIWGMGKAVFQKSSFLKDYGLNIKGYIDVATGAAIRKKRNVIHYSEIPDPVDVLILSYVGDRKGKSKIRQFLISRGYKAGVNFYMMA